MKFAIFGGSFDPIHNGHIHLALSALQFGYDRVIFVPAYQSPFKLTPQSSSAPHRVGMLFAAIAGRRDMTVDLCEIQREGISYTIDTLLDIIQRYQFEEKPGLILGDDLLDRYTEWKGAPEIARYADLLVAKRNHEAAHFPFPHQALPNQVITLSSAQVRAMIADNGPWRDSVPAVVREYIELYRLYGAQRKVPQTPAYPKRPSSLLEFENYVRNSLQPSRFAHSRNVALHCADLALYFGLDDDTAYLAGLTHDLCKDWDSTMLKIWARKDGNPISDAEEKKPGLLHGRAAAVFLKKELGIDNRAVLDAVRDHTIGTTAAAPLSMILYLTDKIEVGRTTVEPRLRKIAFGPASTGTLERIDSIDALDRIEALYRTIHEATRQWLQERGVLDDT